MKTLTLIIFIIQLVAISIYGQVNQQCETLFNTEVFYTNPCSTEDIRNDGNILNTTILASNKYRIYYRTNDNDPKTLIVILF